MHASPASFLPARQRLVRRTRFCRGDVTVSSAKRTASVIFTRPTIGSLARRPFDACRPSPLPARLRKREKPVRRPDRPFFSRQCPAPPLDAFSRINDRVLGDCFGMNLPSGFLAVAPRSGRVFVRVPWRARAPSLPEHLRRVIMRHTAPYAVATARAATGAGGFCAPSATFRLHPRSMSLS